LRSHRLAQKFNRPRRQLCPVLIRTAVLAERERALDPIDEHFDADDRPELPRDVRGRRVIHRPGLRTEDAVVVDEPANQCLDAGGSWWTKRWKYTCAVM
jgi:hypothetical protein